MYKIIIAITLLFTANFASAQIGNLLNKAKDQVEKTVSGESGSSTIADGLKEALNKGVGNAVDQLSEKDGYLKSQYKILIPEDAQKVVSVVKKVPGFENVEDELINKMNDAAEVAAKKATPIFVDAIKQMTIKDAKNILFGEDDAATRYLETSSRTKLYNEFMPIIKSSLKEVNATAYWKTVVDAYNKIPFQKKLNPDLADHVNQKGLDGLFGLIEKKEEGIREDQAQRTSPLLKEVFGQLD